MWLVLAVFAALFSYFATPSVAAAAPVVGPHVDTCEEVVEGIVPAHPAPEEEAPSAQLFEIEDSETSASDAPGALPSYAAVVLARTACACPSTTKRLTLAAFIPWMQRLRARVATSRGPPSV